MKKTAGADWGCCAADFRKVADIIQDKGHLTEDGFKKLSEIKSGMNTGRDPSNYGSYIHSGGVA